MMEEINETVNWLQSKGITDPEVGIVLGTGLGQLADQIEVEKKYSYTVIPNFPTATVEFHFGQLIYGTLAGKKVIALQGRYHYYEGYSMEQIVLPIRVLKLLGVKTLLLSNAAGAINLDYKKGTLMLLDDHINLQSENPLIGSNLDELGPRFPDMSEPYDKMLNRSILEIAAKHKIEINEGVYVSVPGPNLETRAEYRYLKIIGADAVGMSTVPEVIACNHMNLPCCCISVLTDECDPDNLKPVEIDDIIATANAADVNLSQIYMDLIKTL